MALAPATSVVAQGPGEIPDATSPAGRTPPTLVPLSASPVYPDAADGRSARVGLVLTISASGGVVDAHVESSDPADAEPSLLDAALAHARQLSFTPATREGRPVPARIRYSVLLEPDLVELAESPPRAPVDSPDGETAAPPSPPDVGVTESATSASDTSEVAASDEAASTATADGPEQHDEPTFGATGVAQRDRDVAPVAASDTTIHLGALRSVPRARSADILRLAPGVLLTNEGGDGHADRIYLRGFDAREGQDLEITVQGVPVNEPGNPHGEGYADMNFIMPELIQSVRVVEGPFDPRQGNYAVAGSAQFELGLERRGLSVAYQGGSFDTHRVSLLFGPDGFGRGTFVGADLRQTNGFGTNRAARHARAMTQIEVPLSSTLIFRILGTAYATRYGSAGVVREDDVAAGRVGFYGSYDPTQGGDASRYSISARLDDVQEHTEFRSLLFLTLRDFALRSNYTGFLEDRPAPYRTGIAQRGDGTEQASSTVDIGLRGHYRVSFQPIDQPWAIEAGYYARHSIVESSQRRLRFGTNVPYRVDFDYEHQISNVGLYVNLDARAFGFLTLRGGVRADYFHFDTLDRCALHDTTLSSAVPILDVLCYARDRTGPRDPTSRRSSNGLAVQPRGTLIIGPFEGLSVVGSVGTGARAADPSYLGDGDLAPFVSILATEGGLVLSREIDAASVDVRGAAFYTDVGRDLIFNQQEGRYTLAPGTERLGALVAARVTFPFLDVAVSGTWAQARFRRQVMDPGSTYFPPDTGDRVPFVPTWVMRADASLHGPLDFLVVDGEALHGNVGIGATYVSGRALLYGETGQDVGVVDLGCAVGWRAVDIGVSIQNLFDAHYRLSELNYASEFRPDTSTPNLIPVRTFAAGAPLIVMATVALRYDAPDWQHAGGSR